MQQQPRAAATAINSRMSRDLPIPGSPRIATAPPRPERPQASSNTISWANSPWRPTMGRSTNRSVTQSREPMHRLGLGDALERLVVEIVEGGDGLGRVSQGVGDQRLAWRGALHEACRQIGGIAGHRIGAVGGAAEAAGDDFAEGNAEMHLERVAELGAAGPASPHGYPAPRGPPARDRCRGRPEHRRAP